MESDFALLELPHESHSVGQPVFMFIVPSCTP